MLILRVEERTLCKFVQYQITLKTNTEIAINI